MGGDIKTIITYTNCLHIISQSYDKQNVTTSSEMCHQVSLMSQNFKLS